jgi:hypothetical protein
LRRTIERPNRPRKLGAGRAEVIRSFKPAFRRRRDPLMPLSGNRIRMRPLGEPTGRRPKSPSPSHLRRSRLIARPSHRAASQAIAAVTPRFVHKSVHNNSTMAPVFIARIITRLLGCQSSAHRRRLDVEENRPARNLGAENPNTPRATTMNTTAHDVPVGPLGGTPAPHRVNPPPKVNLGAGRLWIRRGPRFRRLLNNQDLTSRTCRSLGAPAK